MNLFELFAKISLDTKEYEKSIKDATSKSQTLSEKIKSAATNSETLKNKVKVLASRYNEAKDRVSKLTDEFNKSAKETGTTSKKTKELAEKLKDAEKEAEDLKEELESYSKSAKNAQSSTSSFASKLGSGLKTAAKIGTAAVAAASTAVVGLATSAIKSYAEYEQLVGGVETLFKDSAGKVQDYANQAYKTANMSANQYMETVTSFSAKLISDLNGDTAAAADLADKAIRAMSDNANTFGTDISLIENAYKNFAKQNYTMLDSLSLGYGGTASEMARLINDSGVLGDTVTVTASNINRVDFSTIIEAINVTQERMGIMGTTANESASTIQGSINTMKGAWENLKVAMVSDTDDIDQRINEFVESVGVVGDNLLPRISTVLGGVVSIIKELGPKIIAELPGLITELWPEVSSAALDLIGELLDFILDAGPDFIDVAFDLIQSLLNGLVDGLKDPEAVNKFVDIVVALVNGLTSPETLIPLINAAFALIDALITALTDPDLLLSLAGAAVNIVASLGVALVGRQADMLQSGIDLFKQIGDGITKGFNEFIEDPVGWGKKIVANIKKGISDAWNAFLDWLESLDQPNPIKDDNISTKEQKELALETVNDVREHAKMLDDLSPAEKKKYNERFVDLTKRLSGDDLLNAITKLNEEFGIVGRSSGLNYVPYNNYLARLHEGEMVLRKTEAAQYRNGIGALGGATINITVNGAQYTSEESLAEAIAYKFQQMINGKEAAYA